VEAAVALHHVWHRQFGSVGSRSSGCLIPWTRWSQAKHWAGQVKEWNWASKYSGCYPPSALWDNTDGNRVIQTRSHGRVHLWLGLGGPWKDDYEGNVWIQYSRGWHGWFV